MNPLSIRPNLPEALVNDNLWYSDGVGENEILFNNVPRPGTTISVPTLTVYDPYTLDNSQITNIIAKTLSVVDLDWNEAIVESKEVDGELLVVSLSTTGDLLRWIKSSDAKKVNISDILGNNSWPLDNELNPIPLLDYINLKEGVLPTFVALSGSDIATVGTPSVTIDDTESGVIKFVFHQLKGATGAKGSKGATGAAGANGSDGISITSASINSADGHLTLTKSDGTTIDVGKVVGEDGVNGVTPVITGLLTTTSSTDGGTNEFTFYSNGSSIGSISVKNGSKGSDGQGSGSSGDVTVNKVNYPEGNITKPLVTKIRINGQTSAAASVSNGEGILDLSSSLNRLFLNVRIDYSTVQNVYNNTGFTVDVYNGYEHVYIKDMDSDYDWTFKVVGYDKSNPNGVDISNCISYEDENYINIACQEGQDMYDYYKLTLIDVYDSSRIIYHPIVIINLDNINGNFLNNRGYTGQTSYLDYRVDVPVLNISNGIITSVSYKTLIDNDGAHEDDVLRFALDGFYWDSIREYPSATSSNLNQVLTVVLNSGGGVKVAWMPTSSGSSLPTLVRNSVLCTTDTSNPSLTWKSISSNFVTPSSLASEVATQLQSLGVITDITINGESTGVTKYQNGTVDLTISNSGGSSDSGASSLSSRVYFFSNHGEFDEIYDSSKIYLALAIIDKATNLKFLVDLDFISYNSQQGKFVFKKDVIGFTNTACANVKPLSATNGLDNTIRLCLGDNSNSIFLIAQHSTKVVWKPDPIGGGYIQDYVLEGYIPSYLELKVILKYYTEILKAYDSIYYTQQMAAQSIQSAYDEWGNTDTTFFITSTLSNENNAGSLICSSRRTSYNPVTGMDTASMNYFTCYPLA